MKRIEALRPLSREHHLSLVLANKAIKTAKNNDKLQIKVLCEQIAQAFNNRWEAHFIKEELFIFSLFEGKYRPKLIADAHEDADLTASRLESGRTGNPQKFCRAPGSSKVL